MPAPARNARAFYVISVEGEPWNLHAGDPQKLAECRSDISWQERGGTPASHFAIAYWDADAQTFRELDGDRTFNVTRGPYTEKAHARHMSLLPMKTVTS